MRWTVWISTCGGIGYFPRCPGTMGSLLGLFLFFPLHRLPTLPYTVLLVTLFVLGVYTSTQSEPYFKRKDASQIVIDELVAMLLVCFLLPPVYGWWIAGFIVFRFFDIKKPFPIQRFEKMAGGLGVMVDDIIAALYTVGLLRFMEALLHFGAFKIG